MTELGWVDNTPTNITDHNEITRELSEWPSVVRDGIGRARQLAWEKAAKSKQHYKGAESTTRKLYNKLAQKQPLNAGVLRTIITDGVWHPERAAKRGNT
eukprot:11295184-Heterocapsa_arctica.AAC.1